MHKVRYKTPDEVERKKLSGTSAIFDVVTKDGQKVHVADQMNNVPVEEHGRHNSPGSPALQEDGRDEPSSLMSLSGESICTTKITTFKATRA